MFLIYITEPEIIKRASENKSRLIFAVAKLTSIKILVTNRRAKNVLVVFIWFVLWFRPTWDSSVLEVY